MSDSVVLEIFSDYVWPWCYFITGSIEKLEEKYKIRVKWRAFPLHPDTPEEGISLDELFRKKGVPVNVGKMMQQLKTTADKLGLELGDRKKNV